MRRSLVLSTLLRAPLLAASLLGACVIPVAHADDFYRTKPLILVVGYAVGGGYDVYARLLARHLPRHIPGAPTIIVQNMPGAGSLTALRHQEAIAPKDGSVVTPFDFFQIINSMFDPGKTNVGIRRLNWLGSMRADLSVC